MGLWRSRVYEMFQHRMDNIETKMENIEREYKPIRKRLDALDGNNLKGNVIYASEARAKIKEIERIELPEELRCAFEEIRLAIENENRSVVLHEYKKEFENIHYTFKRQYHLEALAEELSNKYEYGVNLIRGKATSSMGILTTHSEFLGGNK